MRKIISNILFFTFFISISGKSQVTNQNLFKFNRAFDLISMFYVDTVNPDKLIESAIVEMLKELDPHSVYVSKDEVKEMNEPLEGNFEGIGVQFNIFNDTIMVVNPIPGGPSEKLGIRAGDRIIKIDGQNVAGVGIKNKDVFSKLRGKKGTLVIISIARRSEKNLIDFQISRDKIPIFSLDASYMIDKEIGYIKLNRFSATTLTEFNEAATKLRNAGAKDLILDLAGNGGGYLNAAVDLADQFLPDKKLIVFTEGNNSPRTDYKATSAGKWDTGRLIIIADEGSASASEIVAGAVQDWDRGLVIGRRSFGKGLVQRPFNLPDGSLIRLTVARYYTPSGRLIQKPYDNGFDEYSKDIINRYNNGELVHEDSIHFPDSLKYQTLNYKRTVYGGGGIMPDFFTPYDSTLYTSYYRALLRKGVFYKFVLSYIDGHRSALKENYSDFSKFKAGFDVTQEMVDSLISFGVKEGVEKTESEITRSLSEMKVVIKALIARDLWSISEYFETINPSRPEFLKAIDVLRDRKLYIKKLSKG